jgi:hypothetical protein
MVMPSESDLKHDHITSFSSTMSSQTVSTNVTYENESVRSALMDYEFSTSSIVSLASVNKEISKWTQKDNWACGIVRKVRGHSHADVVSGLTILCVEQKQTVATVKINEEDIHDPHANALHFEAIVRSLHWRWQYLMWARKASRWTVLMVVLPASSTDNTHVGNCTKASWEVATIEACSKAHETLHAIHRDIRRSSTSQ